MVGVSTIAAAFSYSALLAHAHFIRPETQATFEEAAALFVSIIAMGLVLFLILRRSKQQSKGTDSPSSFFFGKRDR
jgi:hypothetical protein